MRPLGCLLLVILGLFWLVIAWTVLAAFMFSVDAPGPVDLNAGEWFTLVGTFLVAPLALCVWAWMLFRGRARER